MEFDIVMEGGGAKGMAFVGAMQEFEARGHRVARLVGTSAGALVATLISAGYTADRLREVVSRRNAANKLLFADVLDAPKEFTPEEIDRSELGHALQNIDLPLLTRSMESRVESVLLDQLVKLQWFRHLFTFIEWGGLYEGRRNQEWLCDVLEEGTPGFSEITFGELYKKTGRDLTLVATDIDAQRMLAMNCRTSPDVPIAWGVRMSQSIPLLWREVRWQPSWGRYLGEDLSGHAIVDGGVTSNFPIYLISQDLKEVVEIMGDTDPRRAANLGLLIDEDLWAPEFGEVVREPLGKGLLDGPMRRIGNLVSTMMGARDRAIIEQCMKNHEICRIPAAGYATADFDLSPERQNGLFDAARRATREYFDARKG